MTQSIETKFNFKSRKITDENNNEIGKTKKQPPLTVSLPVPTPEEVVSILQGAREDKRFNLIMEGVYALVRDQAKNQLDDVIDSFANDDTKTVSPEHLDYDKLTLEYIANLPPAQRGVRAIPEDDWKFFFEDYIQVMVQATGKDVTKIKNHVEIFKKPTRARQNKDALAVLVEQLNIYMASAANIEETGECASRIQSRFQKWAEEEDKFDASAL